ncbi:hypothetical protein DCCM_3620 [Desulfocucumis palustris]|uniref:Uncharacterized protein n=1 Tax=Desulfocucumis palustris TaxID=1898651 RepID=A0A2L2XEE9_9FIRM|nr:hypothetical protein DCCM_3620 [Desulfocucumis palustris]
MSFQNSEIKTKNTTKIDFRLFSVITPDIDYYSRYTVYCTVICKKNN